jgi:hypothetical protein
LATVTPLPVQDRLPVRPPCPRRAHVDRRDLRLRTEPGDAVIPPLAGQVGYGSRAVLRRDPVRVADSRFEGDYAGVFELVVSKLRCPSARAGTVRCSLLIELLARGDPRPVVLVVAPAGYGKTTLLSQWAERSGQAFAWVSLDERDNDPKVLLTYVAAALDAVEPIGERVFDALASAGRSVPGPVVSALGFAFSSMTLPVVLVLDDVHVLDDPDCWAAVSVLADHVPPGSRLVLSGRGAPLLAVARLRTAGRMSEIGPATWRSLTRRRRPCCATQACRSVTAMWRSCTGGPRAGRPGCTWRRSALGRAARPQARRTLSAAPTGWSASTWSRSSWRGSPRISGCS